MPLVTHFERWVLARPRNRRFFSLAELNQAIRELLDGLNGRQTKHLGADHGPHHRDIPQGQAGHLVNKEDAALVDAMVKSPRKKAIGLPDRFAAEDIHFVRVDLNGDGTEEFIAMAATLFTCGNAPHCQTSIFEKTATGLRYIGSMYTSEKVGITGYFVNVEDYWHNGWRLLNNGENRYCWLHETDPDLAYSMEDILGMPHKPGQAGYFTSVVIDDECPDEAPRLK